MQNNPSPLGLEITKATFSDFKKKFKKYNKIEQPNFINGGSTYLVSPQYVPLDNVKDDVIFVFDKNSILESVLIVFDKSKYSELQAHLVNNYIPIIEGAKSMFKKGLTEINLHKTSFFYSVLNTSTFNSDVCTLIYQSRAFSVKVFERELALRKLEETNKDIKRL